MNAGQRANLCVQQLEQIVVVLADDFGDHVERAGGQHHVVDRRQLRQLLRQFDAVARAADADHRLPGEAELHRIGDRDDLHDARVDQPLHPLAHRRLRKPDRLADPGIGPPPVLLQFLDDRLRQLIELHRRVEPVGRPPAAAPGECRPGRGVCHGDDSARIPSSQATMTMHPLAKSGRNYWMHSEAAAVLARTVFKTRI